MSKTVRKVAAEIAGDEEERLQTVLYSAIDQWLQAHVANLLKNIAAQKNDPHAVDRALDGLDYAIEGWKKSRVIVDKLIGKD